LQCLHYVSTYQSITGVGYTMKAVIEAADALFDFVQLGLVPADDDDRDI